MRRTNKNLPDKRAGEYRLVRRAGSHKLYDRLEWALIVGLDAWARTHTVAFHDGVCAEIPFD